MGRGKVWDSEMQTYSDARTGCRVRQLTGIEGNSHHLYFTNPGWFDDGRQLLFGSDRTGRPNLFSVDLEDGRITQHTETEKSATDQEANFQNAALNPLRPEVYYWRGRVLMAVDLTNHVERCLYRIEEPGPGSPGFRGAMVNVTSDGRQVCTSVVEDMSDRFHMDLDHGYVGFDQQWEAMPLSKILTIPVDGGPAREVHVERYWISHVNTSPTQPNLLTYCHEGPWDKVDQRIWGLDLATGKTWPIRPRTVPGERIGHEYWLVDGIHVGYHGTRPDGGKILGRIRYDNTEVHDALFPHYTQHIHSNTIDDIVGDGAQGGRVIRLWHWNGQGYDGPRILCEHECSARHQRVHTHPRFSPGGDKVVFTSDRSGYGQVYEAEVQAFDSLPELAGVATDERGST